MNDRVQESGKEARPETNESWTDQGSDQDSTLLPMLVGGLVMIVIGMVFVMWLT